MLPKWFEEHFKLMRVLLLAMGALNGWVAYRILNEYPIMALLNALMAIAITLGVILLWGAGRTK
jgi:hypothetical protein